MHERHAGLKPGVNVLMSTTDVCAELQVSRSTLYSWRTEGLAPPALKIGRHLRFPRQGFEDWLTERTTERTERAKEARRLKLVR